MTADDHYEQVVGLHDQGKYAEAADRAWHYLQEAPDHGGLWQLYGTARGNLQQFAEARRALETASVLVPLHPLAQYVLAVCYAREGRGEPAGVIFEHLGETVARTGMLSAVAARLGGLGRYPAALKVCRRITDLDPAHHQAFFGQAWYLGRLGFPPEVLIPPLAMALDLAPQVVPYRLNLAFAWADLGDYPRAHELLLPVSPAQVRCPCGLTRMRRIFERVGDRERSLACGEQLAEFGR